MTFSIVAWDVETGMTGVAVATKHLAVGALVPHVKSGVGAIATQAATNPLLGIHGLDLLAAGDHQRSASSEEALQRILFDDPDREQRQLHLVNRYGQTAAWTGKDCEGWAGHLTFAGFSVAGNMLVSEATVQAMAEAYQRFEGRAFCDRLLLALEAGDLAGGDKRGKQSAAIRVMHTDSYPHLDLRVDHHSQPIVQLRETFEESRKEYYQSFRQTMPSDRQRVFSLLTPEPRAV